MIICQGDLFWVDLRRAKGSEPKNRRPVVVVQRDAINQSKFGTVLVVPLTKQEMSCSKKEKGIYQEPVCQNVLMSW